MTQVKIFGREPALIIGVIGAGVAVLAGLKMPGLSAGAAVAIVALITAGITAATTRPVSPSLYVGVVVAGAALLAQYQIHLSGELISNLSGFVIAAFALFGVRSQVTPAADQAAIAPASGSVR